MDPDRWLLLGGDALVPQYAVAFVVVPPVVALCVSVGYSYYRFYETA